MRRPSLLLALAFAWGGAELRAQEEQQPPAVQVPDVQAFEGKIIRQLRFDPPEAEERVRSRLKTRAGQPLHQTEVTADVGELWQTLKILAWVWVEPAEGGGVDVLFELEEPRSYDRIVFRGLDHFSESEVRSILGLSVPRRFTDLQVRDFVRDLETRYARDGYPYARIFPEPDEETSTLTMVVDEGPKVTIGEVTFRGNRAFPGAAPLDAYENLLGGADLGSQPPDLLGRGSPYSEEIIEEDLDKLRVFYRRLGYRDAQVELEERSPSPDGVVVDLQFRVIEGRRYRIRSVDLEHYTAEGQLDPDPIYPKDLLLPELHVAPGEFYDRDAINRDKRAIEVFYGKRGHPMSGRFGDQQIPEAFRWKEPGWAQPLEVIDPDTAEIDLIYQVIEGTPKALRDVVIEGNTQTQDRVIRRKVFIYPGEILDVSAVERSLQILDSLRYFQDPEGLGGVRFELLPVDEDEIDLKILVQEGDTGSFLWGAGISTGFGVQARVQFNKRNFDLFRLPSSPNPVTIFGEILDSKAFHGAGQELNIFLAPGTQVSTFQISFDEPDLFRTHVDTIGLRVQGFRQLRVFQTYDSDTLGANLELYRSFSEHAQVGLSLRVENVSVEDIQPDAPTIVFEDEGKSQVHALRLRAGFRDVDFPLRPSDGFDLAVYAEVAPDALGSDAQFVKAGMSGRYYYPVYRDSLERAHVLFLEQSFDWGMGIGDSDHLYTPERHYMGGYNLRGFAQWSAGPMQFGQPTGGEARYLGTAEYQFPLVSTRLRGRLGETELLRGVLFSDWGLLGLAIDDPTFHELRLSVGVGLRIQVPYLGLPIALDFGFPMLYEQTDDRRVFYFSLAR